MLEKTNAKSAKAPLKDKAEVAQTKKRNATKPVRRAAAGKPAAPGSRQDDLHERVQRRAYELWESEGRPAGREHDHWLQAEREIAKARPKARGREPVGPRIQATPTGGRAALRPHLQ